MGTKGQLASSSGGLVGSSDGTQTWMVRQIAWQRRLLELSRRAEAALAEGSGEATAPGCAPAAERLAQESTSSKRHGVAAFLLRLLGRPNGWNSRRRAVAA
jgi:hypothetical protein